MKIELNSNQISLIQTALRMSMTIWADNCQTAKEGKIDRLAAQFQKQIDEAEDIIIVLFDASDDYEMEGDGE